MNGVTTLKRSCVVCAPSGLLVSIGFLWLFAFTKWYVSRREGAVLVGSFLLYMGWLFYLI